MTLCFASRRTSTRTLGLRYDKRDEEIRYDDLYMAYSGKWIFIRFNQDGRGVEPLAMEDKLARLMEEVETQTARIERSENTELYELLVEIIKLFY